MVVPPPRVTILPRPISNPYSPEGIVADWAERNIASNLIEVFKVCVTFPQAGPVVIPRVTCGSFAIGMPTW